MIGRAVTPESSVVDHAASPHPAASAVLAPRVVFVNVGMPRPHDTSRGPVATAIWKSPAAGRVRTVGENLEGDAQADRKNHGGPHKAIYAYATEDLAFWEQRLGPLGPGSMGENLTTTGIDPNEALIGERWAVGSTILEVSEPRSPCYRLGLRHGDPTLPRAFVAAQRPGTYLRILEQGDIGAGDRVEVISKPGHHVTVRLAFRAWLVDRSLVPLLRGAPQLSDTWKSWIANEPDRQVAFRMSERSSVRAEPAKERRARWPNAGVTFSTT